MGQTVTVQGEVFSLPTSGDFDWGSQLSAWMQAVSSALALSTVGVSPATYGCVGDGVRDDSVEMQDAVDAAIASGMPLQLDEKTYLVKNLLATGALTVQGKGRGVSVLKLAPLAINTGGNVISATSVTRLVFRNMSFDGNKSAHGSQAFADTWTGRSQRALLKFSSCTDIDVSECEMKNAYGAGLACLNSSRVNASENYCTTNNFESVYLYTDGTRHTNHRIVGNTIISTGSGDATINGNAILLSKADRFVVDGNIISTVERNGVKTENCTQGTISDNQIYNVTVIEFAGIQLQLGSEDIKVIGNTIDTAAGGVAVNQQASSQTIRNIVIDGNTIRRTTNTTGASGGVTMSCAFDGADNISICDNVIRDHYKHAIQAIGQFTRLKIDDNTGLGNGDTNSNGIRINASSGSWTELSIQGNVMVNSASSNGQQLRFERSSSYTITGANICNNTMRLTGGAATIYDSAVDFISGVFCNNIGVGGVIQFNQTGCITTGNYYDAGANGSLTMRNQFRIALTTPVALSALDKLVFIKLTSPGAVSVTLPGSPHTGHIITIKDATGDAAANNITITGTIDGAANLVVAANSATTRLVYSGAGWFTI